MKDSVMETVTSVQENAADILASAKEINKQRAQAEEAADADCSEAIRGRRQKKGPPSGGPSVSWRQV